MSQPSYDVIVVGEGVSGLAVAGALAGRGLKVATMESQLFGGLIINVNELEPPLEGKAASGAELASEMMQANAEAGVMSIQEGAGSIRPGAEAQDVITSSGTSYRARHVVIASGARLKRLGVPGEADYEGRGVSQCADCDGPMYQNEDVIVVGGGDSALQEALVLTHYCRRVHLVHRRSEFRAAPHFVDRVKSNDRISVVWNANVESILGGQMVERIRLRHGDGRVEELVCAGVFAYIGVDPNTEFLPPEIPRDDNGYVKTDDSLQTRLTGLSAIGAVRSGYAGTLRHAMEEARKATDAISARLRQPSSAAREGRT